MSLDHRYDFVLLFDVKDGNPNGDPDAGNLPRLDAETGHGLVTDVCLKRKVRNYIEVARTDVLGFAIYVREKAVLGRAHKAAFEDLKISLGTESRIAVPDDLVAAMHDFPLPDGLTLVEDDDEPIAILVAADADIKAVKQAIKEAKGAKRLTQFLETCLKGAKSRKPLADEVESGRRWMCRNYFDIRTFGAVMSLKSAPNCGQVRGPVQMTFARSVDPIIAQEHSITRMAVATEAEAEKQGGDNRTMGRKHTVPYGLYVAHGFVSAFLSKQTGFSETDLELLWESLEHMFEHDRSAARGEMTTRGLYVFEHASELGNAHAHALFDRIQPRLKEGATVPRCFADYEVLVDSDGLPDGVALHRKVG